MGRMRGGRHKLGTATLAAIVAGLVLLLAASAFAVVTVYRNSFGTRGAAQELQSGGGEACDRRWRDRIEDVVVTVKRGPESCGYRPPVVGDSAQPDHSFLARFVVLPDTARRVRDNAWVGVAVRLGGDSAYKLRVFPKDGSYVLSRTPDGGGFPRSGTSPAIKGIGDRNRLELRAFGPNVKAFINGTKVEEVTDANPGELNGRKLELLVGNTASRDRDVVASVDDLAVSVPNAP